MGPDFEGTERGGGACTETVWERIPQMTLQNDSFEERVITMSKANSECTVSAI